ncbi:hypothetical protein [Shewanella cyperi]|uniref:Outer membrane protein beta-barrel domain-containing protein n=1 Tax=Shewanella cyperi TaxID=2814292 RepID=A0A974XN34_9GAMM|nr:hypothetical protein [Shewanella cyperi]QSX31460.1 hypothetical protein JYB88_07545 [Shewanella cyperi]QSX42245.1 hypothetical protein JYB84_07575 [Shewanella cyperi]
MFKALALCTVTLAGVSQACNAKDMTIQVGGFYSQSDSSIDVTDPTIGQNYRLDFESDLELAESQFLPTAAFEYRFNDRHSFYLDWKQLHRDAETLAVSRPFQVQIDDTIYEVKAGGKLATTLNIDIARIGYGYEFLQGNNYSLGVSLGLHAMFIDSMFEGTISACTSSQLNNNVCGTQAIPRVVDESVTAPLPDIGLFGSYEFLPGWKLSGHAQYFQIKVDDIKGSLVDVRAGITADLGDNWQMSVAYNYYKVDVDVHQTGDNQVKVADYNISYSFIGPMFSVSYRF